MVLGRDRQAMLVAELDDISAWTVADVARALHRARMAQGLRLDEVGLGAGVTVKDLRALEASSLDRFPDSLSALRAVRRSADYLGLPGDQLALVLMERWPLRAHRGVPSSDPTSVVPAVGSRDPDPTAVGTMEPATDVHDGGLLSGRSRRALLGAIAATAPGPGTSEVILGDALPIEPQEEPTQAVLVGRATGSRRVGGEHHDDPDADPEAPAAWLRLVVVAVVLAVLAGVAAIVVHNLHRSPAQASGATPTTSARSTKTTTQPPSTVTFTTAQTSSTSATITVGASTFTVTVSAVNDPAWVQVTAPAQGSPVFSGMIDAGQTQTFTVHQPITVETGSVAGHAAVTVGTKQVGTYVPPAAPYYMTFKPA